MGARALAAALLMARKAPSYTNFSRELCYFEHGGRPPGDATRPATRKEPVAKWKELQLANYTRPRLPANNYARAILAASTRSLMVTRALQRNRSERDRSKLAISLNRM